MNECMEEKIWCCFHPREMVVGVCALCLNERLLVLASKQETFLTAKTKRVLPKILALTNFLKPSSLIKLHKSEVFYDPAAASSSPSTPEDSFISIKFEENGVASWDKGKISKISLDHEDHHQFKKSGSYEIKSVIEHVKAHASLRWRRPIGHLVQLIKSKRSSKAANVAGTKLEREKTIYGWIRILTKRRTKE